MSNIVLAAAVWVTNVRGSISGRITSERGQGIMEYGILLGGIALLGAVAAVALGGISFSGFTTAMQDCLGFSDGC